MPTPRISRGVNEFTADVFNRLMVSLDEAERPSPAITRQPPVQTFLAKITGASAVNRDLSPGSDAYQDNRYIFQYSWEQVALKWRSDASTTPAVDARTLASPRSGAIGGSTDNVSAYNLIEIQNTEFRIGPGVELPEDDTITVSAVEVGTLVQMHVINDPESPDTTMRTFYYFSQDVPVTCDDADAGAPLASRTTDLDFGTFIQPASTFLTLDLGAFA